MPANPWLHVPLADYEGHMNAPGVEQLELLADLFGYALVDAEALTANLLRKGLRMEHELTRPAASGKSMWLGIFQRTI